MGQLLFHACSSWRMQIWQRRVLLGGLVTPKRRETREIREAESPEEIHLAESRRSKALQAFAKKTLPCHEKLIFSRALRQEDLHSLLQRHHATPFRSESQFLGTRRSGRH